MQGGYQWEHFHCEYDWDSLMKKQRLDFRQITMCHSYIKLLKFLTLNPIECLGRKYPSAKLWENYERVHFIC